MSRSGEGPRLLTIENDYSLHVVRSRRLEHEVLQRDGSGYFERVWSAAPLTGADPSEPSSSSYGIPTTTMLTPHHTFVEGHAAMSRRLARLGPLNVLLAQVWLVIHLLRLVRRERIDAVRTGDPYYLGLLGLVIARINRIPLVVKVAANYDAIFEAVGRPAYPSLLRSRALEKRIERLVYRRAALVVAGNENNRDYVLANGARADSTIVVRAGLWVDPIHFEPPPDATRSDDLPTRPFAVLVSRLEPVKHPDDVLKAFAHAHAEHPDARLLVIGDGAMRADLEQFADRLGIAEAVTFAGPQDQDNVRTAMCASTVVVAPLAGRALIEATLSGRPVVAYDVEWHSELIDDGRSGFLVPYRDTKAMGAAMASLFADARLAERVGAAGRARCLEVMDREALAAHEQGAYAALLGA